MKRDYSEYSQPYDIKQGPRSSKYPDLSSYDKNDKNPNCSKYPDISSHIQNPNYENNDNVLSKYHIDVNLVL